MKNNTKLLSKTITINKDLLPTFTPADLLIYNPIVKRLLGDKVYNIVNHLTPSPSPRGEGEIVRESIYTNNTNPCEVRKAAFTLSCKSFRSGLNSLLCHWHTKARSPRKPSFACAHSYGFTLAETLIALTVLGIIAAITIPQLIRRNQEAQNRTRIKKAMTVYDMAIAKMAIENNIRSLQELKNWANKENCPESSQYFKISEVLNGNGCTFKTADGLFWDISDITAPIVATKAENLNDPDNSLTFTFQTDEDENGAFRVNDLAYEKSNGYYDDLEKLYAFIQGKAYEEFDYENRTSVTPFNAYDVVEGFSNVDDMAVCQEFDRGSSCYSAYTYSGNGIADGITTNKDMNRQLAKAENCSNCVSKYVYDANSRRYTYYCGISNHKISDCEFAGLNINYRTDSHQWYNWDNERKMLYNGYPPTYYDLSQVLGY